MLSLLFCLKFPVGKFSPWKSVWVPFYSKQDVCQKLPNHKIIRAGWATVLGNESVHQLLSAAERQLSREKENWSVVSLLLWRVFISSARVWPSPCAEGQKHRGPCVGPGAKPSCTEKAIVWAVTVQRSEASPCHLRCGVLPTPKIIGARKSDFQAGPRLSVPRPYPSPPRNPQSVPWFFSIVIMLNF